MITNLLVLPGIIDFIYGEGRQRALLLGLNGPKVAARRIGEVPTIDRTFRQFILYCIIFFQVHAYLIYCLALLPLFSII
jgi:hypothetical protein